METPNNMDTRGVLTYMIITSRQSKSKGAARYKNYKRATFTEEELLVEVEVERTMLERLAFLRLSPHTGMSQSFTMVPVAATGLVEVVVVLLELANLVLVESRKGTTSHKCHCC
ncbi:hypothetical protein PIB30_006913 [Stylosanthes scabra]|uniref:Uncharacterized protein n=1 Tax=Stylosanthes scabra TaxID=79078 RepID=A0ABU6X552_9FABA|nr:hypothetical protein [Stylosanthes scabra]